MTKILDLNQEEMNVLSAAYTWMENERKEKGEEILPATYDTITDFYFPLDLHISFFYDNERDKVFVRTFYHASGVVTYEELTDPARIVNESDASRTITWVLLRSGVFLCN